MLTAGEGELSVLGDERPADGPLREGEVWAGGQYLGLESFTLGIGFSYLGHACFFAGLIAVSVPAVVGDLQPVPVVVFGVLI
ncbi:hypothetical protein D3C84_1102000 [compost metagenome]